MGGGAVGIAVAGLHAHMSIEGGKVKRDGEHNMAGVHARVNARVGGPRGNEGKGRFKKVVV